MISGSAFVMGLLIATIAMLAYVGGQTWWWLVSGTREENRQNEATMREFWIALREAGIRDRANRQHNEADDPGNYPCRSVPDGSAKPELI